MLPEPLARLRAEALALPPVTHRIHSPLKRTEQFSRVIAKVSLVLFTTALLTVTADAQSKSPVLTGAWRLTEIARTGSKAETLKNPQGLLVFTSKYWSRMYIDSDQPRTQIRDLEKATAAEIIATWGPFVAASGTYEAAGNSLTMRALIAKNPNVMAPGNVSAYTFKIEGNTLTMSDTRNSAGAVASPRTFTFIRLE
jgi:Lipocalin-like domain